MSKLRILLVARGEMNRVWGTHKVHLEIKEAYEKQGHTVDILDYKTIYPNGETAVHKIVGRMYTYRFWKYLKKKAHQYDVIDANSECIVYPKESFGFKGVLMVRSHGIRPMYDEAEKLDGYQNALKQNNQKTGIKTRIGNVYRSMQKQPGYKEFWASVHCADLVHCLNISEYDYFLNNQIPKSKLLLVPNGLTDARIMQFNTTKTDRKENIAAFVASWTFRKGIKDLSAIVDLINKEAHLQTFRLLGGHTSLTKVKEEFSVDQEKLLDIIPQYGPDELLSYLVDCKVGIFTSYIEGFGLAVVEQMAAGIPVVAYDVPGPNGILHDLDASLLIEPGAVEKYAHKVASILNMNEAEYTTLSNKCKEESQKYLLSKVATQFLEAFAAKLLPA